MNFFDKPILNSPYAPPARHWELDLEGRPMDVIMEARRRSALWTALPGASSVTGRSAQTSMVRTPATAFSSPPSRPTSPRASDRKSPG